jgi:hypothetical protein
MPWPPRRSSRAELELQREVTTLGLKFLKANSELRTKTIYCQRLEFLLHQRTETIDELYGRLEQARAANQKLEQECEHLADMICIMPQLDPAMLVPK